MATQKYASVPPKELEVDLASNGTTLIVSDNLDWGGNALTTASFPGDYIPFTLINDKRTLIEFGLLDATTISTIATTGATIYKRGLAYYSTGVTATDQTEVTANKLDWTSGQTKVLIGTNPPYLYGTFLNRFNDETITGKFTFPVANWPRMSSAGTSPVNDYDFATKEYADSLTMGGAVSKNAEIVNGNAGETVAAGDWVYLDPSDQEWKKADASVTGTSEQIKIGVAQGAGTDGNSIAGGVLISGLDENQSGLTAGTQYLSDTAGAISNSAGTVERAVGIAISATQIIVDPYFHHTIKEIDKDKLEAITASAAELNQLDGATITATQLNETAAIVAATDITGAELEELSNGSTTTLHNHAQKSWVSGVVTHNGSSGDETIAHGLGTTPEFIRITATYQDTNDVASVSFGTAISTSTERVVYMGQGGADSNAGATTDIIIQLTNGASNVSLATLQTLDATNIVLDFTGADTGTIFIMWEAYG